jgi:hypothetical protein
MKKVVRMKYGTKVTVATSNKVATREFWGDSHFADAQKFLKEFAVADVTMHVFEPLSHPE